MTKKNVKNVLKERHLKRLSLEKTAISQSENSLLNVHTNVDSERIAEVITSKMQILTNFFFYHVVTLFKAF